MMPQTAAVNISLYFKTNGRLIPTSTACTSGSMGIGYAYEAIKDGYQNIMIAGEQKKFTPHKSAFLILYMQQALKIQLQILPQGLLIKKETGL